MLNQPPQVLLTAISHLESSSMIKKGRNISDIVSSILNNNIDMKQKFSRPALQHDLLFKAEYDHLGSYGSCVECDKEQLVNRKPQNIYEPQIHYGLIASGNKVIKHTVVGLD
jgi:hypothetical protein